jgi:hypothetical protein
MEKDKESDEDEEEEAVRRKPYDCVVNMSNFFEFVYYHVGYFCLFGPLWNIILMIIHGKKGYYLFKNMYFWGIDFFHFSQFVYYLTSGCLVTLNYLQYTDIHENLLWLNYISLAFRIFMITSKYGVIDEDYLHAMKTSLLGSYKIRFNLTMLSWRNQPSIVVDRALAYTLKRQ